LLFSLFLTNSKKAVWFVDNFTHLSLLYHNFRYHRTHVASNTFTIPIRPLTLLASHLSPVPTLSYWHRPHTSKTHLPIIFIHGIGIGLIPYIPFLTALNANSLADSTIGILAIELLPISFRISAPLPKVTELISQISTIIQRHGITSFILVTHSYGSVLNTHMIRSPALGPRIFATILVDPVTLLLHTPPVAYNFTLRKPRLANERQLYYFASKDMMVAHTLHRSFFWSANVVWKEDLLSLEPGMLDTGSKTAEKEGSANPKKRHVTVFLGGRDLIVDTKAVAEYLTADEPPSSFSSSTTTSPDKWKNTEAGWTSQDGNLKVVWCGVCDHAQIFDHYRKWRRVLVDEVLRLSALGAAEKAGVIEVEEDEDEVEGQLEDEYKDEEELDEKLEEYMDADVDVYVDVDVDVDVE
jgi:pimeloyl-ACP methyl ester carboxylesterase